MRDNRKAAWIFAMLLTASMAQSEAQTSGHMDMHHDHAMGTEKHWSAPPEAAKRRNPVAANKASIEEGRRLFQENCASCHGPTGRGDGPAAAQLTMMAGHHPAGDLAWKIANGRGAMPPWKDTLNENQIWTLVSYIKTLPQAGGKPQPMEHAH